MVNRKAKILSGPAFWRSPRAATATRSTPSHKRWIMLSMEGEDTWRLAAYGDLDRSR